MPFVMSPALTGDLGTKSGRHVRCFSHLPQKSRLRSPAVCACLSLAGCRVLQVASSAVWPDSQVGLCMHTAAPFLPICCPRAGAHYSGLPSLRSSHSPQIAGVGLGRQDAREGHLLYKKVPEPPVDLFPFSMFCPLEIHHSLLPFWWTDSYFVYC